MFIDRVVVQLAAGKGGNGIVAWRREKYIPKGGPTGGNGGRGGSVILRADPQVVSLEGLRNRRQLKAENGGSGGPNRQQGRQGKDLVLTLPCGTLIKDASSGEVLCDLTEPGQEWLICQGGRGGRGNDSFKTPTRQAPNFCSEGSPGEAAEVEFELKLIADVGLVGFPNAGKSTLINAITRVPVKIAPYPFTTLQPNLGFIRLRDYRRILIADIPGIIEGAHRNRGLGFEFLRHIERTRILLYMLDASGIDGRHPIDDYKVLQQELEAYDPALLQRSSLVILNKMDVEESVQQAKEFREAFPKLGDKLFEISAHERTGLAGLVKQLEALYALTEA
jgi:GTP-binding protein